MQLRSAKSVPILPILAATALLAGCKNDLPDLVAGDGSISSMCQPYADLLLTFRPPGSEVDSEAGMAALGAPDDTPVWLEVNAVLVVGFVGLGGLVDMPGDDVLVHSTAAAGAEVAVYVGTDPDDLRFSGSLTESNNLIDISTASATRAVYMRLVAVAGTTQIDAFEALQTPCPTDASP
jgi:hypothetical protein